MDTRIHGRLAGLALALLALAGAPSAQRGELERKAFEDKAAGYRIKPPKGWNVVPVQPNMRELGVAFQATAPDGEPLSGEFNVIVVDEEKDLDAWLENALDAIHQEKDVELKDVPPRLDEPAKTGGAGSRHRRWLENGLYLDVWYVEHASGKVGVIATVSQHDKYADSWLSAYERSVKGIESFAPSASSRGAGTTYEEKLERARLEAERTKGWHVVPTPSQKFILTTSSDNQKFVDEVIDRLERSRLVFEEDYPPPADFDHVSIVRVCANAEEFHRYGGTGGGVMGWFNPATTELVLFDAKDVDRNMSYAVMTHEAFHQYCHFLFGRSEAHRWFDEGHGDYYGGMKFAENGKPKVTARMPGGLERLSGIKEMVQLGTAKSLREHLNYDHQQWQKQDPQNNVACYCQSWSIVYMLRQGMLGNVNSKVWKKEYAQILPHYIETLRKGFEEAYAEELAKRLKTSGGEEKTTATQIELDSDDLGPETVKKIWTAAMEASWGQVDLDQFEEDWKLYVKKYLKD